MDKDKSTNLYKLTLAETHSLPKHSNSEAGNVIIKDHHYNKEMKSNWNLKK